MKFPITTTVIAFIGLATASPATDSDAKAAASCNIGPVGNIDQRALQRCLDDYRNGNWDGMDCGGRGWFKGGRAWNSPNDCYDGCAECIKMAISARATGAQCDQTVVFAGCWMGYH